MAYKHKNNKNYRKKKTFLQYLYGIIKYGDFKLYYKPKKKTKYYVKKEWKNRDCQKNYKKKTYSEYEKRVHENILKRTELKDKRPINNANWYIHYKLGSAEKFDESFDKMFPNTCDNIDFDFELDDSNKRRILKDEFENRRIKLRDEWKKCREILKEKW